MKKKALVQTEGIFLVNKPQGLTSHDIVDVVRKKLGIRRVGHAGTLDPLAEGLLIILVGRATKLFPKFSSLDKQYEATLRLGVSTDTGDSGGRIIRSEDLGEVTFEKIEAAFKKFEGEILQSPHPFSALRYRGKRLYQLARQGKLVNIAPRRVKIFSLKIIKIELPFIDFFIHCSKGTYIRKLAEDIGDFLGCGAHITKIKRIKVGSFSLEKAANLENIDESLLLPVPNNF
ncbi:MAG: tRNA pseudouridine(55) synthase TruB [Candidatus Omnitrophica bacterium]|nr:tRNA pseudouridine(55) synthase TruB [Candidatus Omnitrophota bacterium]